MGQLRLGRYPAPRFRAKSSIGPLRLYDYLGDSWGVLFSHPADFTPVCTTELGYTAKLAGEFAKRNVKVLALSVDPVDSHTSGSTTSTTRSRPRSISPSWPTTTARCPSWYDMIHPNANATLTVRSVFVIDPARRCA